MPGRQCVFQQHSSIWLCHLLPQTADQPSLTLTNMLHLAQMILEQDTDHCTLLHLTVVSSLLEGEVKQEVNSVRPFSKQETQQV